MLPKSVLKDVLWRFSAKRFASREAFCSAVRDYQIRILDKDDGRWKPESIVLPQPAIEILYDAVRGESYDEARMTLRSENPAGFTAGELLHQLHEALAGEDLGDHVFFEGLALHEAPEARDGKPALYELRQGS